MKRADVANEKTSFLCIQETIQQGINEFIHLEVSGSVVLLIATVAALILANSPWAESYAQLWKTEVSFKVGSFTFYETLQHWINDFLGDRHLLHRQARAELAGHRRRPVRAVDPL